MELNFQYWSNYLLIAYLMKERKKLEKIYQELNEGDTDIKRWNQALIPKAILLELFNLKQLFYN